MIKPGEIDKIAIEKGVRAKQIEKDYVISWVLWGIAPNQKTRSLTRLAL